MNRAVYIDLFDDGIPTCNPLLELKAFEGRLLDVARFQVMLAVLLGRPVVVPETWATSSPLFLMLANEVLSDYPEQVWSKDQSSGKAIKVEAPPPFVFRFQDARDGESAAVSYLRALQARLQGGRRLLFADTLARPDATPQAAANPLRDSLANVIADILERRRVGRDDFDDFHAGAMTAMERFEPPKVASATASSMRSLLRYLRRPAASRVAARFDEAAYRQTMAEQVGHVHAAVASGHLMDEFEGPLTGFQRFFAKAEQARKAQNLSFADVMGMQRLLIGEPPDVVNVVEAFGRYVLNRAYAASVSADSQAVSLDYYCRGQSNRFESELLKSVVRGERRPNQLAAEGPDFDDFINLAPQRDYDLADSLDWPKVWRQVAQLAVQPDWIRQRDELKAQIYRLSEAELRDPLVWRSFFDSINVTVQDLVFKLDGGDRPTLRMIKTMPLIGSIAKKIETFGGIAQPPLKLAAKALAGGSDLCAASLESVVKLFGLAPTRVVLNLERQRRHVGSLLR